MGNDSQERARHLECNLDGASEATVSTCMRWHLTRAQQPGLTLRQTGPGRGQPGGPGRGLGVAAMATVSTLGAARVPSSASSRLQLRAGSEADGSWEKTAEEAAQISGGCRPPPLLQPRHPDPQPQPTPHHRPELDPGQTHRERDATFGCSRAELSTEVLRDRTGLPSFDNHLLWRQRMRSRAMEPAQS